MNVSQGKILDYSASETWAHRFEIWRTCTDPRVLVIATLKDMSSGGNLWTQKTGSRCNEFPKTMGPITLIMGMTFGHRFCKPRNLRRHAKFTKTLLGTFWRPTCNPYWPTHNYLCVCVHVHAESLLSKGIGQPRTGWMRNRQARPQRDSVPKPNVSCSIGADLSRYSCTT